MKKVLVLSSALIAALIISACSKSETQNLLIGTWTVKVCATIGIGQGPIGFWNITFGKHGKGEMVLEREVSSYVLPVEDVNRYIKFNYSYDEKKNTIEYKLNGKTYVWKITNLTYEKFTFHSNRSAIDYLLSRSLDCDEIIFYGEKIE